MSTTIALTNDMPAHEKRAIIKMITRGVQRVGAEGRKLAAELILQIVRYDRWELEVEEKDKVQANEKGKGKGRCEVEKEVTCSICQDDVSLSVIFGILASVENGSRIEADKAV